MIWINIIGIAIVVAIVWWFWIYTPPTAVIDSDTIEVVVENGVYQPAKFSIPANQDTTVFFTRLDPSPCAEILNFPELDISVSLPLNAKISVVIPASAPGRYTFQCQMKMYEGECIVK